MVNHWWRAGLRFGIFIASGDYIVAAFSHLEVGIDIEQKRKARMEVARRFFPSCRNSVPAKSCGDAQDELFFRYWSVKESFLKYTGSGLSSPLSASEVRFDDHRPLHISVRKPSKSLYLCLSGSIPHTNASFVQRLPKNPGSFHSSSRISSCRMNNRCYSLPSV